MVLSMDCTGNDDDATALRGKSITVVVRYAFLVAFAVWTAVLGALFIWDAYSIRRFALHDAQSNALASYNKDVAFREWVTTHGGVYVPVDEATPPNPYLANVKERDIVTPSGRHLTLMNPAYMVRQMNEFFAKKGTVFGHITSLNLKNPNNKPDKWEENALMAFEKGEKERIGVADFGGKPFLRLMRPMITKEGCLKCHADQGYKVGDIRGGVSVSVGLEPYYAEARALTCGHAVVHGLIWLVGSLGFLIGHTYARRLGRARDEAREAMSKSEELLNAAQRMARVGGWEFDVGKQSLTWTDEVYRIHDIAREDVPHGSTGHITRSVECYAPESRPVILAAFQKCVAEGVPYDMEFPFTSAKGRQMWIRTSAQPVFDNGKVVKVIGDIMDITDIKAEEEKLKAAKKEAEAATLLKDKFVSLVAHDLKSPIGHSVLALKNLRDRLREDGLPVADDPMLTLSIVASENMQRLIDDLLNIGRFKTGRIKLNRQFFDAKYLGVKMAADYSAIARQKGIEITNTIPENSRIYADKELLTEAVQNLVTNAIKFCARGDQITISLAEKDATAICVRDTGPGIRPDMLDNIFKYEKKTTTKGTAGETGTGFGLPLTKDIIELHGGEMGMKSEPGKGCLFSLKLPDVRPQILLVDNDSMFRLVLKLLLKELGADVIEAGNGEEALNIMAGMPPHLIMTDVKMPGMDGIEFLKRVKDGPDTKDIPVFVVTGEYSMEIRDTVFKLGADDFATKDINTADFLPRVRRYIG